MGYREQRHALARQNDEGGEVPGFVVGRGDSRARMAAERNHAIFAFWAKALQISVPKALVVICVLGIVDDDEGPYSPPRKLSSQSFQGSFEFGSLHLSI